MQEERTSGYLSTFEAAQILKCAPDTVRWMALSGRLAIAIETRAGRLFRRGDVEMLALARTQKTAQEAAGCVG